MVSTITSYSLIVFRKKFYFPNDLIIRAPQNLDQVYFPPSRCLTIYEISLRVGLQFFLPSELIDISTTCGVSISQFSYRAMSIVIGLIVFFRDHGEVLTPEFFSHMGRFTCDIQSHRSKSWDSEFFFVKNNWNLIKKWGKLKELPVLLHIGEEDILGDLKILDVKNLLYEICYLNKYIEEDYLFKVGCSCGEDLCNYEELRWWLKRILAAVEKNVGGGEERRWLVRTSTVEKNIRGGKTSLVGKNVDGGRWKDRSPNLLLLLLSSSLSFLPPLM
ncbi:hypothetical protein IEQ34_020234 [Dendrobium chrysotoxum]|uniref:Uncharacterized protein n=1 Tax=Dendrobium chrysotoxum TaxID=161865 RepID=A0AAV7G1I0_DENCH|nr:hypothetical protein IEQ34_020234 [Dendrobium chrysotoxum]